MIGLPEPNTISPTATLPCRQQPTIQPRFAAKLRAKLTRDVKMGIRSRSEVFFASPHMAMKMWFAAPAATP